MRRENGLVGQFPRGQVITAAEREVLLLKDRLRVLINRLSPLVHASWQCDQADVALRDADISLTVAGASLQREVRLFGSLVIEPIYVYWEVRELLTKAEADRLLTIGSPECSSLLAEAIQLDSIIRSKVGGP